MKAYLLIAGTGSRLRPLTDKTPKCLLPINGTPLLNIWLNLCYKYKITEVLINTYYLSEQVEEYLNKQDFKVKIQIFHEKVLLGSATTVLENKNFVEGEKDFFIFYGDTLTNINLDKMLEYHKNQKSKFTLGLFQTNYPKQSGIVELNKNNLVTSFIEKPKNPKTCLANAGIYLATQDIFNHISGKILEDFGHHVLPTLVNRMYGYEIKEFLMDIGTLSNYDLANKKWKQL